MASGDPCAGTRSEPCGGSHVRDGVVPAKTTGDPSLQGTSVSNARQPRRPRRQGKHLAADVDAERKMLPQRNHSPSSIVAYQSECGVRAGRGSLSGHAGGLPTWCPFAYRSNVRIYHRPANTRAFWPVSPDAERSRPLIVACAAPVSGTLIADAHGSEIRSAVRVGGVPAPMRDCLRSFAKPAPWVAASNG